MPDEAVALLEPARRLKRAVGRPTSGEIRWSKLAAAHRRARRRRSPPWSWWRAAWSPRTSRPNAFAAESQVSALAGTSESFAPTATITAGRVRDVW
ncbi:MAG: hypothetical protein ACLSVD_14835 [Eggerthellaceae bacterium]